ncbi:MAG: N-acetyl-gamma-glutamyl-phosphate reductase [Deltaproteobacteria bacterium]|nr:N-acetyl-gamma-glutamyl-phosphate reductase [Deltaproteobacteria bacterium]MCB9787246.1 N-acetyl-gamma-glutamyl-phosphate reductase [Deltaproteobacteria bacterium]
MGYRVGIAGITGYTGVELVRLAASHPELEVVLGAAGASAGQPLSTSWPGLQGLTELDVESIDPERLAACDVVFLALPHGHAARLAPQLVDAGVLVVDLGADFRLRDPEAYARYYGLTHPCPERLPTAVYGLPELTRGQLAQARLIANPGCYPTAVTLAALPLVEAGLVSTPLVASCVSGVSGAGRSPGPRNIFCETHDSARPYGIAGAHRHTPEIEQNLGCQVVFSPHLVPMNRGMIATVHARLARPIAAAELQELYATRYADEPMVQMRQDAPGTADVRCSNRAHVHVALDAERATVTAVAVIDNLMKGAAGQAVQAMNVALGLPEGLGLPLHPVMI